MDQQVPLGATTDPRADLPRPRPVGLGALGHLPENDDWSARDLAREFGNAHVGSRRFRTGDTSRNSFWVAMLTFGEAWHATL